MAATATRPRLEQALRILIGAMGETAGALELDFYGAGGGYVVIAPDNRRPFGERRRSAGEMLRTINFAIDVASETRRVAEQRAGVID